MTLLYLLKIFLEKLTDNQKTSLANVMITEIYNKGEVIANEGEAANSFFIIKKVKHLIKSMNYDFRVKFLCD